MTDSKDEEAFHAAYRELNAEQKQAVDTIEGPVMVIAGPGTGKTQILTLRIANILLRTDTAPENILALTFTEAGARAMRERLYTYAGSRAYQVKIQTFHAFADSLIREYPEYYERIIGSRAASDIEKVTIIEDILANNTFTHIRPTGDPLFYVKSIRSSISTMKREYITPETFSESVGKSERELAMMEQYHTKGAHKGKVRGDYQKKEKNVGRDRELLLVYRLYEKVLADRKLYDFDDMIFETVRALESREDFLRSLQETYHYILADEHQDVNGGQNRILDLIASYHERPNIFVVGDEKQAIYRFQGASLENFLYFEERFPHTTTIALTKNYRSGQTILDAAHSLIAVDDGPAKALRVPLTAERVQKSVVEYRQFSHQAIEDDVVAARIAELLTLSVPAKEIALIVRTNAEVEAFAHRLKSKGVPVRVSSDTDALSHPIAAMVHALIAAVVSPKFEEALFRVLHGSFWGIARGDLVRVLSLRNYERPLAQIIRDEEALRAMNLENVEAILRVSAVLDMALSLEGVEAPHRLLEKLLRESGFLDTITRTDPLQGGAIVRRLYDEAERMVIQHEATTLQDIAALFHAYQTHGIALTAPTSLLREDAVSVMTAHKSKGLEFAHVFIPHLVDSAWGGSTRSPYFTLPVARHLDAADFDPLDDERRLLYVALTRAKEAVYLSVSETNAEGREFSPSRLLTDIEDAHVTKVETKAAEDAFGPLDVFASSHTSSVIDVDVVKTLFLTRGLSATALNNYIASPWQYLYRNILRVPEVQSLSMLFGTALHEVLEQAAERAKTEGEGCTPTWIAHTLTRALGRLPLTTTEYASLHEKGLAALTTYVPTMLPSVTPRTRTEYSVKVMLPTGLADVPSVPLTGKLDRVDFDADGRAIHVVDYKSGKPKTRGEIEGTTKSSDGGYKRQLTFYALMLSLLPDERYHTKEGVISFVEPDARGKVHEEVFHITEEEVRALKETIVQVTRDITNGAWMHAPCDSSLVPYCDLASLLKNP